MSNLYKIFFIAGAALIFIGALLFIFQKLNIPVGRLPGDIAVKKENFSFYFPWVSCLLASVVLTIIMSFFRK